MGKRMKFHLNNGRDDIGAACGEKRERNVMARLSMVNCKRCLRTKRAAEERARGNR